MTDIFESEILNDDDLMGEVARGLFAVGHPLRIRCLVLFANETSPTEIQEMLAGPKLGAVSYHIRALRDAGLIRETRTEARRGALEHYYRRTPAGDHILAVIAPLLGIGSRGRQAA